MKGLASTEKLKDSTFPEWLAQLANTVVCRLGRLEYRLLVSLMQRVKANL
jgi:hypothetical protein